MKLNSKRRTRHWCGLATLLGASLSLAPITQLTPGAQAGFPGRNGRIAVSVLRPPFTSLPGAGFQVAGDRDIFTISPYGGAVRQVTTGPEMDGSPAWSPDGQSIAFLRADISYGSATGSDIYVVGSAGGKPTNITNTPDFYELGPSWSPDGTKIVFSSDRSQPDLLWRLTRPIALMAAEQDLYVMNADGSDLVQLTSTAGFESNPSWSPDGEWIAFESVGSGRAGSWIEVIRPDGSGRRVLQTEVEGSDPQWSPDGNVVAFADASGSDIWLVSIGGAELRNLSAKSRSRNTYPTWSPDGQWIAFISDRDGAWKLYKMRADGSRVVRLLDIDLQSPGALPDWGPRP